MRWLGITVVFAVAACASPQEGASSETAGGPATTDAGNGGAATGGSNTGTGGSGGTGGTRTTGSGGTAVGGTGPKPLPCGEIGAGGAQDLGPTGVWTEVTPAGLDSHQEGLFGPGLIFTDPARPSDLYVGGGHGGFWKSSDYGATWSLVNPVEGHFTFNLAHDSPDGEPTMWTSPGNGSGSILRSTDGAVTWVTAGNVGVASDPYSVTVDPYDSTHILTGLHEAGGIFESTDSGDTWKKSDAFPSGGISWYPFFIDTGNAATTRKNWLAIAQNDVGTEHTTDGGATWANVETMQHPHGNSQIFQNSDAVFMGGIYGSHGSGVYRSTDLGATFTHVGADTNESILFGTPNHVYALYGWAAACCGTVPNDFQVGPAAGDTGWKTVAAPMQQGANKVAVTCAGGHYILVGQMWWAGIWRYIEP